jgi:hypothetical protein
LAPRSRACDERKRHGESQSPSEHLTHPAMLAGPCAPRHWILRASAARGAQRGHPVPALTGRCGRSMKGAAVAAH